MVVASIKQQILDDLDRLSPDQQHEAAMLVHSLVAQSPRGASLAQLRSLAGSLDDRSAREMAEAIEEGCERVDRDEW